MAICFAACFKGQKQLHCSSLFKELIPIREQTWARSHLGRFRQGKWLARSTAVTEGIYMCDSLELQRLHERTLTSVKYCSFR